MVNLTLGLFIAILAGLMFGAGTILQKKAASALPRIESQTGRQNVRNFLSNRTWLLGIALTTAQWYVSLLAIPLLPLSLFSSLMGVNLAILVVFSHLYLKEPVGRRELYAMAAIIAGAAVLGFRAHRLEAKIPLPEMIAFFSRPRAIGYTVLLLAGVAASILHSRGRGSARGDVAFGVAAGFLLALGQIYSKAFMSGFNGDGLAAAIRTPFWWIFLLLLAVGNLGNMVAIQYGFQKGKAVVAASLAQVIGSAGGILGGVIILGEWEGYGTATVGLKIGAVAALLAGVVVLSRSSQGLFPPSR
jgi:drug/metabolite transporter (DMT)-like permease